MERCVKNPFFSRFSGKERVLLRTARSQHIQKIAVDRQVVAQLRVDGGGQLLAQAGGHDAPVHLGQDLDLRPRLGDVGSADEGHGHRSDPRT